jgi:hypothetical protein
MTQPGSQWDVRAIAWSLQIPETLPRVAPDNIAHLQLSVHLTLLIFLALIKANRSF